jgi:hypothetical protein
VFVRDADELADALRPDLLPDALKDTTDELVRTRDAAYRMVLEMMRERALDLVRTRITRVEHTRSAGTESGDEARGVAG